MRPGFSVRLSAPLRRILCATAVLLVAGACASLAQDDCVGFIERAVTPGGTNGATSVYSADVDGDGDLDVLSASFNDDMIAWHENTAGDGTAWRFHVISTSADGAMSVFAADLNNDGAMDVLSASAYDNTIAWYQNIGSDPPAFVKRVITRGAVHAQSVFAADLDDDGDIDVLAASFLDGTLSWFENLWSVADPIASFTEHVISSDSPGAVAIVAADVDGDEQLDVVAASYLIDTVAWYESEWGTAIGEDGSETPVLFFTEHLVTTTAAGVKSVSPADVGGDGFADLFVASMLDHTVARYENTAGDGTAWETHEISTEAHGVKSVHAAGTGDDVIVLAAATDDDALIWYERDAGSPSGFSERARVEGIRSVDTVFAADVDDDGHLDALSASSVPGPLSAADKIAWYENELDEAPGTLTEWLISGTAVGPRALDAADLDGDGDLDVAGAGGTAAIGWYENRLDAAEQDWEFRAIPGETEGASSVHVDDIDSDGLRDIVASLEGEDKVVWFENEGGDPPSFAERLISDATDGPMSVFAADLDGDGDPDVVSASFEDDTIAWHENRPGEDWVMRTISEEADGAMSVFAADIDSDGFMDLLSASYNDGKIAWYESDGAVPPGFTEHILASGDANEADNRADGAASVVAADLDGDDDMDVVAALTLSNAIVWYENDNDVDSDGALIFTRRQITAVATRVAWVATADLDSDGDVDVLTAAPGNDLVAWFENDGNSPPAFSGHEVGNSAQNPRAVIAAEFSGDDRLDLFVGFDFEAAWYERVGEICVDFDANDDGTIDGTELSWMAWAFSRPVTDPIAEWWAPLDYNADGIVDGDDLAILGSGGVWGQSVDTCQYSCR